MGVGGSQDNRAGARSAIGSRRNLAFAGAGGAALGAAATRGGKSKNVIVTQEARNSSGSSNFNLKQSLLSVTLSIGVLLALSFVFISNFQGLNTFFMSVIEIMFTLVSAATGTNIQSTGMFATFDGSLLSFLFIIVLFAIVLTGAFASKKLPGALLGGIIIFFLPFILYFLFVELGRQYLGGDGVQFISRSLVVIIGGVAFIYILTLLFSQSEDTVQDILKELKILTLALFFAWFILFLLSGSASSLVFQEQVSEGAEDVRESTRNFQLYWRCEVMQGTIRGLEECNRADEETQVRRQSQEVFIFEEIRDSSSNVIRQGRETVQFNYYIMVPRSIDVRLTGYSCRIGTNRTQYEIPQQFSRLTQEIPLSGTNLRIECPVLEKLDSRDFQRGIIDQVNARVYFEVQDTVHQQIPYVNCADPYFETQDFTCSNLARENWNGKIDDPRVLSFLNSVNDLVYGLFSTRGTISGLRGNLPLYLNDPDELRFSQFDYSINFKEDRSLKIQNITLNDFRTPNYIEINQDSLIRTRRFIDRDGNSEISFPIELILIDQPRDDIGSFEIMSFDFTINHYFEINKRNIRIDDSVKPEEIEEPESIGEIVGREEDGGEDDIPDDGGGNGDEDSISSSGGDSSSQNDEKSNDEEEGTVESNQENENGASQEEGDLETQGDD
ncbi:MAG: hypothetical protein ACMXYB_04550 [Candidatus Woesearchaeota archaeon]